MSFISNLKGTLSSFFRVGNVRLNDNNGNLEVKNSDGSQITAIATELIELPVKSVSPNTPSTNKAIFFIKDGLPFVKLDSGIELELVGVTGFTTTINTTSPNNVINVAQLLANVVSDNGDVVITPKGTGAFILGGIPDWTSTNGNKRGARAVDLQLETNASTRVASGANSFAAVRRCAASGAQSMAMGDQCTASQTGSMAMGYQCTSSQTGSMAMGYQCTSSGTYSMGLGLQGHTQGLWGKYAFGGGQFSTIGDCQFGYQVLRRLATDTTPVVLTATGSTPTSTNQIQLQNNQTIKITCDILARSSTGLTKNIEATAVLKRGANAASTTISTPIYTTIFEDAGTENWTMVLSANTTTGCGVITFTIDSTINVRCMAKVKTVELTYQE
jgi:hypothetical protein